MKYVFFFIHNLFISEINIIYFLNEFIVPPRWIVEPVDVSVERNRHITLHCQAQGVPTPNVVWKKSTGVYTC